MSNFYKSYCALCVKKGVTVSGAAAAIGLSNAAANGWKNGKVPQDTTLVKLADYFGVSVEELIGEKEKSPAPNGAELDEDDLKHLRAFHAADEETKAAITMLLKKFEKGETL